MVSIIVKHAHDRGVAQLKHMLKQAYKQSTAATLAQDRKFTGFVNPSLELAAKWATPVNNMCILSLYCRAKLLYLRAKINGTEQKQPQGLLY